MRILSLFDGMACGMIAFKVAGIPIDSYDAYEIDKFAVQVATHNFPEIKEHGDVFKADFTQYEGVDLVLTHKGRYQPVTAVGQKKAKIYEVDAMGYPKFKTTANHPFYTISRRKATYSEYKEVKSWRIFSTVPEWKRADALTNDDFVGMRIVTTSDKLFDVTEHIDAEFCYILGRYLADGHLRKAKRKNRNNSYQYHQHRTLSHQRDIERDECDGLDRITQSACSYLTQLVTGSAHGAKERQQLFVWH